MDQVGLGWRTQLTASILLHLNEIDLVEVIIDDYFKSSKDELRSLKTLGSQVPVLYHGVSLGLASANSVDKKRLIKIAKTLDYLNVDNWSEHLAFVRAGSIEIGHLAAPPRNYETIEGTLNNLIKVKKIVGSMPSLENIATLINPPNSILSEGEWTSEILNLSNCNMLLDLHNLYANAVNTGQDPFQYMKSFPLHRVRFVHLSGGHWINEPIVFDSTNKNKRLLDDHIHDVPEVVFELLEQLTFLVKQPLKVIIERDGQYPEFSILINQVRKAKRIMKNARDRQLKIQGNIYERTSI